jgi:hypothetical protein
MSPGRSPLAGRVSPDASPLQHLTGESGSRSPRWKLVKTKARTIRRFGGSNIKVFDLYLKPRSAVGAQLKESCLPYASLNMTRLIDTVAGNKKKVWYVRSELSFNVSDFRKVKPSTVT